nr:immunoglobulin heavy chain junction region [Mus musculus]NSM07905.1 immunoglobulin heavy chain junction region [Mus musculus]
CARVGYYGSTSYFDYW